MSRSGFTLVELLLVIAIIAVLAALLIPMIGYAKNMARNAKAEAQLGTIKASLNIFKDANGFYPEKSLTSPPDVFSDVFKKTSNTNDEPYKTANNVDNDGWDRIAGELMLQLQTVDRDNYRNINALRDPFTGGGISSRVYRYRPSKFYPLSKASGSLFIDQEDPPNPDSYQLWSAGIDSKDQYGEVKNGKKSDDIINWKSK
jgi:prepilin-type N-terminal cleavage/methylation domain-containing protein